jgi:MraZ protein
MFFGKYNHSIDQKGRMRIPAKLRQGLGERFYVMRGTPNCLYIFTEEQFNIVNAALSSVPLYDVEKQKLVRKITSSANHVEEDNQGRFLLDSELRELINIQKDVVFVGAGKKIELWSKENWDKENAVNEEDYSESLSLLTDLGI